MDQIDEFYCPLCASDLKLEHKVGAYKKTYSCTASMCPYKYTVITNKIRLFLDKVQDSILNS